MASIIARRHGHMPFFDLSTYSFEVDYGSGSVTLQIYSQMSWTIGAPLGNLGFSERAGDGSATITISYPAITAGFTESFTIAQEDNRQILVTFTESAKPKPAYDIIIPVKVGYGGSRLQISVTLPSPASSDSEVRAKTFNISSFEIVVIDSSGNTHFELFATGNFTFSSITMEFTRTLSYSVAKIASVQAKISGTPTFIETSTAEYDIGFTGSTSNVAQVELATDTEQESTPQEDETL